MRLIKAGQTVANQKRISVFLTDDDTDLVPQTGITIDVAGELLWSKNGAAESVAGGVWAEPGGVGNGAGLYTYVPTDLEVNATGSCSIRFKRALVRTFVKDVLVVTDDRITT